MAGMFAADELACHPSRAQGLGQGQAPDDMTGTNLLRCIGTEDNFHTVFREQA
jgi:hypothetical protein